MKRSLILAAAVAWLAAGTMCWALDSSHVVQGPLALRQCDQRYGPGGPNRSEIVRPQTPPRLCPSTRSR